VKRQRIQDWLDPGGWLDAISVIVVFTIAISAVIVVAGYTIPSKPLQAVGAILFGAGVSALIGTVTGARAIHQQSAKEANIWRKQHTYGPLYAELKEVRNALYQGKMGRERAPQWIARGDETGTESRTFSLAMMPNPNFSVAQQPLSLGLWLQFLSDYRFTDFKPATQDLLNQIHPLTTTYNVAVQEALQATGPILGSYLEVAIRNAKESDDHKHWEQQKSALDSSSGLAGQQFRASYNWFGHFEDEVPINRAMIWLVRWPDGGAPQRSIAMGWLLAGQPVMAAKYIQQGYPAESAIYPQPPLDWIQSIFEQAWPEVQENEKFRAALAARDHLLKHLQTAENILADTLRLIQKRYEGGEPLA
jgi:hypothetical protein